jgi:hypothetical protein
MKRLLALPLLFATIAATAPKVEAVTGDWSKLPALESRGYDHLNSNVMQRLWELASEKKCTIPGYSLRKLDLRLSFAVQYNADGSLGRLLVPAMNCPEAEGVIAGAIIEMMQGGDYRRTTAPNPDGWYQGALTFGYEA